MSGSMRLQARLDPRGLVFRFMQRRLAGRTLALRIAFWDGGAVDLGPAPVVTIRFATKRPFRCLLLGNVEGLGDCYVAGDIEVEGEISDILRVGIGLAEAVGGQGRVIGRLLGLLAWRPGKHGRQRDATAVRSHYDVSNAFYALWLDRNLTYSCAYFHDGDEDIDRAQEQKYEHLCRKLRLAPGERLLDVGCGWGGLLRWAARHHGVTGVGVTLSERQAEEALRRIAAEGLGERIEIRLQDYRDIPGTAVYDKIVSVGMFEHVGRKNLPLYFATLTRLLRPGGLLLNHGITTVDAAGRGRGPAGGGFLERHVFPDGELVHVADVLRHMGEQDLEVLDVESLRPHYARTLRHWVRRLEAARETAIREVGPEKYRIWRMYMAGCAFAFDRNWLSVYQVLAEKPEPDGAPRRPWTRAHQYLPDAPVRLAGPLDWEA